MERGRTFLCRQEWRPQDGAITRYRIRSQHTDSRELRSEVERRHKARAPEYVEPSTEGRRQERRVDVAEFSQRAVGSGRFAVLGRDTRSNRRRQHAEAISGDRSGQREAVERVSATRASRSILAKSRGAAMGVDKNSRPVEARPAKIDRR